MYGEKNGTSTGMSSLPTSKRDNSQLVSFVPRELLKHHMVLPSHVENRLQSIEKEYAAKDRLGKYNLSPKRKILLHGSPGCGKTLSAERIAWNLGLPLLKVRFDALLSSYFMPGRVRQAWLDIMEIQRQYRKSSRKRAFNPGLVFCNAEGRPYESKELEKGFKKSLLSANIREVNLHATRHTFATAALFRSTDVVTVSEILGHAAPSTTLNMYGHTFDDRKKALMALFK